MKVVCMGDSITAGQYAPDGSGWVELLGWENRGACGDTTRLALERFPRDVQESGADAVTIQFGHNDANRWRTDRGLPRVRIDAFVANLREMIDRARAFGIVPVLVGLTAPDRATEYVRDCRIYDQALRATAVYTDVACCEMWPHFSPEHYLDGGLHLNEHGHRIYAERVAGVVRDAG